MKKTDNREKAVALRYQEKKDDAPRVVATGKGLIARKIKEIALANGVPIYQDKILKHSLIGKTGRFHLTVAA